MLGAATEGRALRPPSGCARFLHRPPRLDSIALVDWGFIWLMFALKIPLAALLWIVWWAVHAQPDAEPLPNDGDGGVRPPHPRHPMPRNPRRGPHRDGPAPAPARVRTSARHARRRTDRA
jgi:hypothetical protein